MKDIVKLFAIVGIGISSSAANATDTETSLRCNVPSDAAVYARQFNAVPGIIQGSPVKVRTGQPAPALMVEGWNPSSAPLASVLSELGKEAGFAVIGADGFGIVSWDKDKASLSDVLDNLTSQVGASWSFSSGVVTVSKAPVISTIPASIKRPENRDVSLALLDTLRGYNAMNVALSSEEISFSTNTDTMPKIISGLASVSEIFAFDVSFSQGRPSDGRYNWSALGPVSLVANGAGGKFFLGEDGSSRLGDFLASSGDVRPGGTQTVAGPSGWSLVVPQSQCGNGATEVTLKPKRVGDGFSLQMTGFEGTMDVPLVTLGQTLVIASKDPIGGWINIMTIRPRILAVK